LRLGGVGGAIQRRLSPIRWAARTQVDVGSLLQTHTEVAIALAGFASVVAVLRRPLSPVGRLRFLSLLFTALIQVLGCLVPVWLSTLSISGSTLWQISTAIVLVLSTTLMLAIVRPQRALDSDGFVLINAPVDRLCKVLILGTFAALLVNTLGIPAAPGFGLYYTALLLGMIVIFVMFANEVVSEDGANR
jgi:hypothetical protein